MRKELIFVYNADSGLWNGILDSMHKLFSPKTYACSLCAMTYSLHSMYPKWKQFLDQELVNEQYRFLHKDELVKEFGKTRVEEFALPAVFYAYNQQLELVIPEQDLNQMTLETLILRVRQLVSSEGPIA